MPMFIDNRGRQVVPSLATLAIIEGCLKESAITCFGPTEKRTVLEQMKLRDSNAQRYCKQAPIYLVSDLSAQLDSDYPLKFVDLRTIKGGRSWNYDEPVAHAQNEQQETGSPIATRQQWQVLKENISELLMNVSAVVVRTSLPGRCNISFPHIEGNKTVMVTSMEPLIHLSNEGVDLRVIRKIFFEHMGGLSLPDDWFNIMPSLSHLNLIAYPRYLTSLLPLYETLEELRMNLRTDHFTGNFEQELSKMSSLRLLFVECLTTDFEPFPIAWESLELSPRLRSLTLLGIAPATAADIIGFLTKEVIHGGKAVARQDLLDNFTVTGIEKEVMLEIYQSDAITERMKERIFCDISLEHITSTILMVFKIMDYGFGRALLPLFKKALELLVISQRPPQIMIRVVLEVISCPHRRDNSTEFGLPLTCALLSMPQLTERFVIAHLVLDMVNTVVLEFKRGIIPLLNTKLASEMIAALDMYSVTPSNGLQHLQAIGFLMIYPGDLAAGLPSRFVKWALKFHPAHLDFFFMETQDNLSMVCFFLIKRCAQDRAGPNQDVLSSFQVNLADETIEMLDFILRNTKETNLLTAVNAVLRRSTKGPHEGIWFDSNTDQQERNLLNILFRDQRSRNQSQ